MDSSRVKLSLSLHDGQFARTCRLHHLLLDTVVDLAREFLETLNQLRSSSSLFFSFRPDMQVGKDEGGTRTLPHLLLPLLLDVLSALWCNLHLSLPHMSSLSLRGPYRLCLAALGAFARSLCHGGCGVLGV